MSVKEDAQEWVAWPSGVCAAGVGSKPGGGAAVKSCGAARPFKVMDKHGEVRVREMSASEPLGKASLGLNGVKTDLCYLDRDESAGYPCCWAGDPRRRGGMNLTRAVECNCGNHRIGCEPKGTRCVPSRPTVGMPMHGAGQLVRAVKAGNAAGAKGLRQDRRLTVNSMEDEL